ncbi:MAG TPA: hypothetical protein PLY61_05930, partial [Anaerohalosphaeraceae bacterium]|nr:hypothetical protein [Anaerohalosphaeraceae bacterium]
MKIQFDANQDYQLEAVKAVTDLFRGQPVGAGDFRLERTFPQDQYLYGAEFVVGNHFAIDETTILENLQAVQQTNGIAVSSQLDGLHFSLEMETGTGKTYV